MSSSSASDARRKAEIEAKKAKLQQIRRQREERAQRLKSTSTTLPETAASASSRKDLDDLVNSLISGPGSVRTNRASIISDASSPRKPLGSGGRVASGGDPASSEFGGSESELVPSTPGGVAVTSVGAPADATSVRSGVEMVEVETELFELPQKQRVFYTKQVQTTALGDSDDDHHRVHSNPGPSGSVGAQPSTSQTEESLRAKILAEHHADLAARREEERLERELAHQLRELTEAERLAVYSAHDFSEFVEHSTKIVERALTDTYDYMRDYRVCAHDLGDGARSASQLSMVTTFGGAHRVFANRSVTAMDWSTKYPELVVVAYNRNEHHEDAPDGLVAVWNLHLAQRPEFVFHAQTDVLSVCFSPFHPNLIVGGTYSGQILIWDTTARSLPVLKTPLSAAGHTHPVYALKIIGSANAHNLVSASTDGTICWWMLDMLARPQETLQLINTLHPKTDEIAITSLGVGDQETTTFLVASEDGNIYAGNRYDRAGLKAGLNMNDMYRGHVAPVTSIDFHPLNGSIDFSDLFLSASMDWTSKLWRIRPASSTSTTITPTSTSVSSLSRTSSTNASTNASSNASSVVGGVAPILSFEDSNDYIYDVRWAPHHPAVFAQVDGTGRLDVFNLNVDTERPVASVVASALASGSANPAEEVGDGVGKALNKVSWSKNGSKLGVGGSDGMVYIYEVNEVLVSAGEDEFKLFQNVVAKLLSSSKAAAATNGVGGAAGVGRIAGL